MAPALPVVRLIRLPATHQGGGNACARVDVSRHRDSHRLLDEAHSGPRSSLAVDAASTSPRRCSSSATCVAMVDTDNSGTTCRSTASLVAFQSCCSAISCGLFSARGRLVLLARRAQADRMALQAPCMADWSEAALAIAGLACHLVGDQGVDADPRLALDGRCVLGRGPATLDPTVHLLWLDLDAAGQLSLRGGLDLLDRGVDSGHGAI